MNSSRILNTLLTKTNFVSHTLAALSVLSQSMLHEIILSGLKNYEEILKIRIIFRELSAPCS